MKIAIMQPYFFPYIGYFQAIYAADKYLIYENLDFITEGWMNRNRILIKNQKPTYINALIANKSSNKKIYDVELFAYKTWKKKLLNSIELNYRGSKFFNEIFPVLEAVIKSEIIFLHQYNSHIIKTICIYLGIKTEIISQNNNYLPLEENLLSIDRSDYSHFPELLKTKPIKKVARVLSICKAENANIFINAIGGQELYNKNEIKQYGIDLFFLETKPYIYQQFSEDFFLHLSIIDVLMHNGKEGTMQIIKNFNLI